MSDTPCTEADHHPPPTVMLDCECGYEGPLTVTVTPGAHATMASPAEPDAWRGKCPKCHQLRASDDLDECPECHVFGGEQFLLPTRVGAYVCASCFVNEAGYDPLG